MSITHGALHTSTSGPDSNRSITQTHMSNNHLATQLQSRQTIGRQTIAKHVIAIAVACDYLCFISHKCQESRSILPTVVCGDNTNGRATWMCTSVGTSYKLFESKNVTFVSFLCSECIFHIAALAEELLLLFAFVDLTGCLMSITNTNMMSILPGGVGRGIGSETGSGIGRGISIVVVNIYTQT